MAGRSSRLAGALVLSTPQTKYIEMVVPASGFVLVYVKTHPSWYVRQDIT